MKSKVFDRIIDIVGRLGGQGGYSDLRPADGEWAPIALRAIDRVLCESTDPELARLEAAEEEAK